MVMVIGFELMFSCLQCLGTIAKLAFFDMVPKMVIACYSPPLSGPFGCLAAPEEPSGRTRVQDHAGLP